MRTDLSAPAILRTLAIFALPSMLAIVAVLGPTALLLLELYFRTRGRQIARDPDTAFAADPRLSSAWRDLDREFETLFETYSRGRSRDGFRVNRKSDWRFDQRRHAAADANRDLDATFARFYEVQHIARGRFAIWKWHTAGARAADVGALTYIVAVPVLWFAIGNAAFAISGAIALLILAAVLVGYGLRLTPGNQRRIVNTDITWETLARAYEASEEGAEL
jgi:hypothetical protein